MKKIYALIALVLLVMSGSMAKAQCPNCVIGACTSSPAQPTICPAVMPDGVAMQAYNQDVSFYLPHNFIDQGTGYNVDLDQLDVLNVVGLPFGLSFQTNASPSNIYYPTSNPPTSEYGCGKICGTPLMAGSYTITVFVLAHVTVNSLGGITSTSNSSFDIPITILPAVIANNGFTILNPYGCAPLTTGFTANHHSNGNPNYHYNWNFGNGNLSVQETPVAQTYNTPGNYIVSLQTQIDTLPYYLSGFIINAAPDCNDSPWSAPDYYFVLKLGGNTIYSSPYIDNTNAPVTFSFSPIQLSNATYTIETWDYDSGLAGGDDHCGDFTFPGNTAGTYTLTSGNVVVTYTVTHPIVNYTDVDTIKVYQSPTVSPLTVAPNDSVCNKDTVFLTVTATNGNIYQWYNDTNAINNANTATYAATSSGKYLCEVSNANGCRKNSNMRQITVIDNPSKPGTWITGYTLNTNATDVDLQWYFEGNLIPNATSSSYAFTQTGHYFVIASNFFGCATSSDTVLATYTFGIDENSGISGLQIFPNPNDGKFHLNLNSDYQNSVILHINDMMGREVFNRSFITLSGKISEDIDLSNLPNGIYMVEIEAGTYKLNSKIVIQ